MKSVKEDTTLLTCVNGHPLFVGVTHHEADVWYDQEDGVTSRLYRSKVSQDTTPDVFVTCEHACKIGRYEDREIRRMYERTPK